MEKDGNTNLPIGKFVYTMDSGSKPIELIVAKNVKGFNLLTLLHLRDQNVLFDIEIYSGCIMLRT